MKRLTYIFWMSLGLVYLILSILLISDLMVGLIPDQAAQILIYRQKYGEALAVQYSILAQRGRIRPFSRPWICCLNAMRIFNQWPWSWKVGRLWPWLGPIVLSGSSHLETTLRLIIFRFLFLMGTCIGERYNSGFILWILDPGPMSLIIPGCDSLPCSWSTDCWAIYFT